MAVVRSAKKKWEMARLSAFGITYLLNERNTLQCVILSV